MFKRWVWPNSAFHNDIHSDCLRAHIRISFYKEVIFGTSPATGEFSITLGKNSKARPGEVKPGEDEKLLRRSYKRQAIKKYCLISTFIWVGILILTEARLQTLSVEVHPQYVTSNFIVYAKCNALIVNFANCNHSKVSNRFSMIYVKT